MSRLNQLHANDYPSQMKINAEFSQLYSYLIQCEKGNYTLPELLSKIFDTSGAVSPTFIEFRWEGDQLQYRVGGGPWLNTGADLGDLQGPPGPSGSGTGDMVRAVYDPNNDSKIGYAEMLILDNELPQAKVNGLVPELLRKARAEVGAVAPVAPTYPPGGAVSLWLDVANPATPVWKYWDGVASWRNFVDVQALSGIEVVTASLLAGESIASRSLVTYFPVDFAVDNNFELGFTPFASAGAALNAFDDNVATSCDTASPTGFVGCDRGAGNEKRISHLRVLFEAGVRNHSIALEHTLDGVNWILNTNFTNANYDGNTWSVFHITNSVNARAYRIRGTGGTSNLIVREMIMMELVGKKNRVHKASNDIRGSFLGIALENGALDARFKVQVAPGLITGMAGLVAGNTIHSTTVPGTFAIASTGRSFTVGEARSVSELNFIPQLDNVGVGQMVRFLGPDANIPANYYKCDGRHQSRVLLQETLYSKIGVTFGVGDGVTTFSIPNEAGFIIRAW